MNEIIVNEMLLESSMNGMAGIIKYTDEPVVRVDFNGPTESCIFASEQTRVVDNHCIRVLSWYDNEWSFSCRLVDTAHHLENVGVNQ